MRSTFCAALVSRAPNPDLLFLTGDLGFQALEPLLTALGERFLNAGVAEQNMVSVAAGLAREGFRPWVYSIAPFVYARPYEQVRNDVCLHALPVTLVGNGGGYAYGVMGCTHHALEDYGALLCLPHLRAYIPAFAVDVPEAIASIEAWNGPAYLRLGRCERPEGVCVPPFSPWRRLLRGRGPVLVAVGPLAGPLLAHLRARSEDARPDLWVIGELPVLPEELPAEFLCALRRSGHLMVVEEHVAVGSVGAMLAYLLLQCGAGPRRFTHRYALGYPSGCYGSQAFHRKECGLDVESVLAEISV